MICDILHNYMHKSIESTMIIKNNGMTNICHHNGTYITIITIIFHINDEQYEYVNKT